MKRWILRLLVVGLVLWGGWWWLATTAMVRGFNAAADGQARGGWALQSAGVAKGGFPFQLAANVTDLSAASDGLNITLPTLAVSAPVYWPGFVTIDLPAQPIVLDAGQGAVNLTTQNAQAGLRLHPGTELQLETMTLTSDAFAMTSGLGPVFTADQMNGVAKQSDNNPQRYDVTIDIAALTPGPLMRQSMRLPNDWPTAFDALNLLGRVTFDRPWDRTAGEGRKPQPTQITLEQVRAHWGALQINAAGTLDVDPQGVPTGALTVGLQNWKVLVGMLEQNGLVDRSMSRQIDFAMKLVARPSAEPGGLELDVTFKNGRMAFGPIDLGPAPRIVLP